MLLSTRKVITNLFRATGKSHEGAGACGGVVPIAQKLRMRKNRFAFTNKSVMVLAGLRLSECLGGPARELDLTADADRLSLHA